MSDLFKRVRSELPDHDDQDALFDWAKTWAGPVLRNASASAALIWHVIEETDANAMPFQILLGECLDQARMGVENRNQKDAAFLKTAEAAIADYLSLRDIPESSRVALAGLYARAHLTPPDTLRLGFDSLSEDMMSLPDDDERSAMAQITRMRGIAGGDGTALYTCFQEAFAGWEAELLPTVVTHLIAGGDDRFFETAICWLLDPNAELRAAAAEGFGLRIAAGLSQASQIAELVQLRSWMPDEPARVTLDKAIAAARKRGLTQGAQPAPWTIHKILASLPDGTGSLQIVMPVSRKGRREIVMLLLKQGFGVRDAFCIPCDSATEQKNRMAQIDAQIPVSEITQDDLTTALEIALGDGLAHGFPPAPGLSEVARRLDPIQLRPGAHALEDLLEPLAAEVELDGMSAQKYGRLINASADWEQLDLVASSWFEQDEALSMAMDGATPEQFEATLWQHLETRRDWWALQCVRIATVFKTTHSDWRSFAAVAHALRAGRPLKKIPIMSFIQEHTLEVLMADQLQDFLSEDLDDPFEAPDFEPERRNELKRILKQSDITPEGLDGYQVAMMIAPLPSNPAAVIGPMISAIPFRDEAALERFLEIAALRSALNSARADDPLLLADYFEGLNAVKFQSWAAGFDLHVSGNADDWDVDTLSSQDRTVLEAIRNAAKSSGSAGVLPALLPNWIASFEAD